MTKLCKLPFVQICKYFCSTQAKFTKIIYKNPLLLQSQCRSAVNVTHVPYIYKMQKRFMRSTRALITKTLQSSGNSSNLNKSIRNYATDRVHTPKPTTSSNESLNNNPAITFIRKKKPSTVVQHSEWVQDFCDQPGCQYKSCLGLCGKKISSKSKAHFTHSNKDEHKAQKVANQDLEGNSKPLYAKPYEKPHETSGDSYDPEADKEKTNKLKQHLKDIQNENT